MEVFAEEHLALRFTVSQEKGLFLGFEVERRL